MKANKKMSGMAAVGIGLVCLLGSQLALSGSAANTMALIKSDPVKLRNFLFNFPKGGDLHNHLTGAIYAESYIAWAAEDEKCWEEETLSIVPGPCDEKTVRSLSELYPGGRNADRLGVDPIVDALSTRNYPLREVSGHNQFFATFARFSLASVGRRGEMLAEVAYRNSRQNIPYLELMQSLGMLEAAELAVASADLDKPYGERIDHAKVDAIVADVSRQVDEMEKKKIELLGCEEAASAMGCEVEMRFLAQVLRTWSLEEVYVQTLLAFKLIESDPRFVGLNFVAPEDHPVALRDYRRHMAFIQEIGSHYEEQRSGITLHAGELALGLVPPENLGWHIQEAIEVAGARRIGHGVDINHTPDLYPLLKKMASEEIMVEINLTSNDVILGVKAPYHPLPLYLENNVPVALSTDDEGVSRIDLTHEYQRAVSTFDLSYAMLRSLSRNALQYNFLPGDRLFLDTYKGKRIQACNSDTPGAETMSTACSEFLGTSEKAALQWQLEERFAAFEASFE